MNIKEVEKSIITNGYYHKIENNKEIFIEKGYQCYIGIIRNGVDTVEQVDSSTMIELKNKIEQIH